MSRPSPARACRTNSLAIAGVVAAFTMIAPGCGSSESSSVATTATTAAAATTAASAATTATSAASGAASGAGTTVTAAESEFKIELGASTFAPGAYTFNITNNGEFKHNLVIEGPGVDELKSDTFDPGNSGSLAATLQAGSYQVYCSIPTHKDKGMELTITVA